MEDVMGEYTLMAIALFCSNYIHYGSKSAECQKTLISCYQNVHRSTIKFDDRLDQCILKYLEIK